VTPKPQATKLAVVDIGTPRRSGPGRKKWHQRPAPQSTEKPSGEYSPPPGPVTADEASTLSSTTPRYETAWARASTRTR